MAAHGEYSYDNQLITRVFDVMGEVGTPVHDLFRIADPHDTEVVEFLHGPPGNRRRYLAISEGENLGYEHAAAQAAGLPVLPGHARKGVLFLEVPTGARTFDGFLQSMRHGTAAHAEMLRDAGQTLRQLSTYTPTSLRPTPDQLMPLRQLVVTTDNSAEGGLQLYLAPPYSAAGQRYEAVMQGVAAEVAAAAPASYEFILEHIDAGWQGTV